MEPLQRMLIEHECQKLQIRYAAHLDKRECEAYASLWTEDGMYKPAIEPEPIRGRDRILAWARAYTSGPKMVVHITTNLNVEVIDEDHAIGRAYVVSFREPHPRPDAVSDRMTPRGVAEYFDAFRRTDEGWRFSERYYQLRFMDAAETNRPLPWTP